MKVIMDDDKIKAFTENVSKKIKYLNETTERQCWLCDEVVRNWICLIPKKSSDDLGFGSSSENSMRIAFIPVCEHHDLEDEDIINEIQRLLFLKSQTLRN